MERGVGRRRHLGLPAGGSRSPPGGQRDRPHPLSVDGEGVLTALPQADSSRLDSPQGIGGSYAGCDRAGSCWRISNDDGPLVEASTDDGQTWTAELTDERRGGRGRGNGGDRLRR